MVAISTEACKRANTAQIDYTLKECLGRKYSPEQEPVIYCDAREIEVVGGERAGKSFVVSDYLVGRYWIDDLFWLCGDDYSATEKEFSYIADGLTKLGLNPDIHWHDSDMSTIRYTLEGQEHVIKTRSLLKWLKIASEAPGLILMVEAGRCSYSQYKRLRDRTMEKRATLLASGTIEMNGWWPEKYQQGQIPGGEIESFSIPSWSNPYVYPGGRTDPEILRAERENSREHFLQHFAAVPAPPRGLVFKEFRNMLHVRELEFEDAPVFLWIDPGYRHAYAVEVVQIIGEQVRVVDEIYEQGLITDDIIDIVVNKPWWHLVAGGVVDRAAKQHQAMPAVIEVWRERTGMILANNYVEEAEGRERVHSFLKPNPITMEPGLVINEHCRGLISEFGGCPSPFKSGHGDSVYAPYKWKESSTGEVVGKSPEDKNNDAIKAITYGLVDHFGYVNNRKSQVGRTVMKGLFS